jgi:hypothetical protein
VAERFAYKAFEDEVPPVMWVIKLDERGAKSIVYRCKQVIYIYTCM